GAPDGWETVASGSAGATAALSALRGGLLGRLRRASRTALGTGGPRLGGVLVQGQRNSGRVLKDREPAHSRDLGLRHHDRASRGLNLPERAINVFAWDVVEDARGEVLSLLKTAIGGRGGLEQPTV